MDASGVVYVVEDNASVRESIAALLEAEGFCSRQFADAPSFLAALPDDRSACVVIDVRLPGPSGLDLQSRLARLEDPIPVVIISAHADVPMAVRALKAGAVDFVEKPFSPGRLIEAAREALQLARHWHRQSCAALTLRSRLAQLSDLEREILRQVTDGTYNKVIAASLGVSVSTVEAHRRVIMKKLGASSLYDLVRITELAWRDDVANGTAK